MIYVKSILAGITAVVVFISLLLAGLSSLAMIQGGYFGWDWAWPPTWTGSVETLLIFAAGFYWEFRRTTTRRSSSQRF